MDERTVTDKNREPPVRWPVVVAVVLAIAVLYTASVGPGLLIARHGILPESLNVAIRVAYMPLFLLTKDNEALRQALFWYLELWKGWLS